MSTHQSITDPRNETIKISINGEFFPREDAKISVFDSGYLVGDGIWEALRLQESVLVFWEEHVNRLFQAAKTIALELPFTKQGLFNQVWACLEKNQMTDGVHVRIMVTRGNKQTPSQDPKLTISGPNVVIISEYKQASPEVKAKGITLFTSTIRRGSPDYLDPKLNCHSKLHEVIALHQAQVAGFDEALMLDIHGFVSTCNATNFFMVKNDEVYTSTGQYCMNGITRAKVIEACVRNDIPIHQKNFSLYDAYGADEAFVTGSFGGITPVNSIDERTMSNPERPMTKKLQALYQELISENIKNHKHE